MSGSSKTELLFDQATLKDFIDSIQATGPEVMRAADMAARDAMRWMQSRISREVSVSLGIPLPQLKTRITQKRVGGGNGRALWVLFLGVNQMPIDIADPGVSQTPAGLKHKGGMVQGGFHKDVFHHGRRGWIRKKRARDLGLKLPGLKGSGSGVNIDGRFPVLRISHDLHAACAPIFKKYEIQGRRMFETEFNRQLLRIKGIT